MTDREEENLGRHYARPTRPFLTLASLLPLFAAPLSIIVPHITTHHQNSTHLTNKHQAFAHHDSSSTSVQHRRAPRKHPTTPPRRQNQEKPARQSVFQSGGGQLARRSAPHQHHMVMASTGHGSACTARLENRMRIQGTLRTRRVRSSRADLIYGRQVNASRRPPPSGPRGAQSQRDGQDDSGWKQIQQNESGNEEWSASIENETFIAPRRNLSSPLPTAAAAPRLGNDRIPGISPT